MRGLRRDQKNMYYSLYGDKIPVLDDDGYETGDYTIGYSEPVPFKASKSGLKSKESAELFGINEEYDSTLISFDDTAKNIKKTTVLFVDVEPNENHDNYDYRVKKTAKTDSSITIAIQEITQSE